MSETTEKKSVVVSKDKKPAFVPEVVLMMSKITEHKLNGLNYLERSKKIHLYVRSICMVAHLNKDPPTNDLKELWMEENARLYLEIRNSIDSGVIGLINHCEFVKKIRDCLEFLYYGKGNVSRILEVCKAFHRLEKHDRYLTTHFMELKKIYE